MPMPLKFLRASQQLAYVGILLFLPLLALLVLASPPALASKTTIYYPQPESDTDERSQYPLKMLELALSKAGGQFELLPSKLRMSQNRALLQLANDSDIQVFWSMTSKERELDLLPVRIPLDKGLLGWRIFLINKKNLPQFAQIKTLQELKKLEAGQGHDWPDTRILRANGIAVQGVANYEHLFKMLENGMIDYFPRSVIEIWQEEKNHPNMGLMIEPRLVLHYPAAMYFFVNKNNAALAGKIEAGLQIALKDGSFDKLFYQFHGDIIKRAQLKERLRLTLQNPVLPQATPLTQADLWLK